MRGLRADIFTDRREAGAMLADRLGDEDLGDGVVVGLARGGVVVAAEVALRLGLELDALAVRKVGHPLQPEFAIGAVTPDGNVFLRAARDVDVEAANVAVASARAGAEALDRRLHSQHPAVPVEGRVCVLVDDGLATGATMVAAVQWARGRRATRVVVAVPVGPAETVALLRREADAVVCLETPATMFGVGEWYEDFRQVPDDEVIGLLAGRPAVPGQRSITIGVGPIRLAGDLALPTRASGVVVFAHGSGSSRHSPRNRSVARRLNRAGLATLLLDLLTPGEELDRALVFDIPLLAERLAGATRWLSEQADTTRLPIGYFGASTGAAAALWAAAGNSAVRAVVSRGGRPDLAGEHLASVRAPTLLIVGGDDDLVLALNREAAAAMMRCPTELVVIPGATHLFEEPGALELVSEHATRWFLQHLPIVP